MRLLIGTVAAAALIGGCGGGGGNAQEATNSYLGGKPAAGGSFDLGTGSPSEATASALGLWRGNEGNGGLPIIAIVLGDGTYYIMYGSIVGFEQGTGSMNANTFNSADGKDFYIKMASVKPMTLSATVSTKQSFNGTTTYAEGTISFTSTYDSDFEKTPAVAEVAGTYGGTVTLAPGDVSASVSVSSDGAITGNAAGCAFTGRVTPRTDGNVYDTEIAFGPAPCYYPSQTFNGISYYDAANRRLYTAAKNADRTEGIAFTGTK